MPYTLLKIPQSEGEKKLLAGSWDDSEKPFNLLNTFLLFMSV